MLTIPFVCSEHWQVLVDCARVDGLDEEQKGVAKRGCDGKLSLAKQRGKGFKLT